MLLLRKTTGYLGVRMIEFIVKSSLGRTAELKPFIRSVEV